MELQRTSTTFRRLVLALGGLSILAAAWILMSSSAQARLDISAGVDAGQPTSGAAPRKASKHKHPSARDQASKQSDHHVASKPDPKLAEVRNAAGEPLEIEDDTCEANMAIAANQGLRLPSGWELHCVGPGLDWESNSHWGVTCRYDECPEGAGPYVSISNPTYYVVAHELCHANFGDDEAMADNCAAERGASLATSPYR